MDLMDYNSDISGRDGSDSESTQSTPEEERIRRLFVTCDTDGDGYITSEDILEICVKLNLEYSAKEIMEQLGANEDAKISFNDFVKRRFELLEEMKNQTESIASSEDDGLWFRRESSDDQLQESFDSKHEQKDLCAMFDRETGDENPSNTGSLSEDEGGISQWKLMNQSIRGSDSASRSIEASSSAKHESSSWEFDSGTHDLEADLSLQKLIENSGHTIPQEVNEFLEIANKLHLNALSGLKQDLQEINSRLHLVLKERDLLEKQSASSKKEQMLLLKELERKRHKDCKKYEDKITELNTLIAELSEKLELQQLSVFNEEDEDGQSIEDGDEKLDRKAKCYSQAKEDHVQRLQMNIEYLNAENKGMKLQLRKKDEEIKKLEDMIDVKSKSNHLDSNDTLHIDVALNTCLELIMASDDKKHISECVQLEMDKLKYKILHMQSQIDLNNLHLDQYKANCEKLTVLLGKYESNNTGLQLILTYFDQIIEAYDIVNNLLESEMGLLLASCRAAGLGKIANVTDREERNEIENIFFRAKERRNLSENKALEFMHKIKDIMGSNSVNQTGFNKQDQDLIRNFLSKMLVNLVTIRKSLVHIDNLHEDQHMNEIPASTSLTTQKLDLENVVLMQELMALKEEKAELKSCLFILEKEKSALTLKFENLKMVQSIKQNEYYPVDQVSKPVQDFSSDKANGTKLKYQVDDLMDNLNQVSQSYELAVQALKSENGNLKGKLERIKRKFEVRSRKLSPDRNNTKTTFNSGTSKPFSRRETVL